MEVMRAKEEELERVKEALDARELQMISKQ